ncbi:MAG: CAP domain-containing protein [Pyrinomonadaceae bacterium]
MTTLTTLTQKMALSAALALLSIISLSQDSFAQNTGSKPIARLISTSSGNSYSRPRRAETGAESASASSARDSAKSAFPSFKEANSIERRAFELTNEIRMRNGLTSLTWDPGLCRLARAHSEKMARLGFFSHATPEGQRLRDRAHAIGIERFRVLAENIAYNQGYEDPGAFAVERWMISPGHRANILYVGFQAAAVGVYVSADGSVYLTQALIAR